MLFHCALVFVFIFVFKEVSTLNATVACIAVLLVSTLSSMIGIGGGTLYVPLLLILGVPFHQSVVTSQFVILLASLSATLVYKRSRRVDWKLALYIEPPTLVMAFIGGCFSGAVNAKVLEGILAVLLFLTSYLMLRPAHRSPGEVSNEPPTGRSGWRHRFANREYQVNLAALLPVTALAGLLAGAEGISGGILKVPLMVLLGGVPMEIAAATSALMVTFTATTGLMGHLMVSHLDLALALPLAVTASFGGYLGARLASRVSRKWLRLSFAIVLTLVAGWLSWTVVAPSAEALLALAVRTNR